MRQPASSSPFTEPDVREVVERVLTVARERLGMQIAWLAELDEREKVFRLIDAEPGVDWSLGEGERWPIADSYCARMLAGQLAHAVPDTAAEAGVADLEVTARVRIGAYVGVPVAFLDDGRLSALCCAHHDARPLDDRDVRFLQLLGRLLADEVALLEAERRRQAAALEQAAVQALTGALDARDGYTGDHTRAVVTRARAVAERLGLPPEVVERTALVATLHDIGKLSMPDAVLRKRGELTAQEREVMHRHTVDGALVVAGLPGLAHLAPLVRATHERWDGAGYPDGLAGDAIPVESRIVLVCDALDAMVTERPYRRARPLDAAVAELRRERGRQFWAPAVDALLAHLGA